MPTREHPAGEDLSASLDAALPPAEAARVRSHLAHCALCRGELEGLAAIRQELASLPPLRPSAAFVERVLAALPATPVQPAAARRARPWPIAALRGAAAVLLLGLVLLLAVQRLGGGTVIGLLVRALTLPAIVATWCFRVLVAFPGGGAVLALAPVAGALLACILLLGTALRAVLRAAPAGLPQRAAQP